jgi:hypothetical protein
VVSRGPERRPASSGGFAWGGFAWGGFAGGGERLAVVGASGREHLVAHPGQRGRRRQAAEDLRHRHDSGRRGAGPSRPAVLAGQFGGQRALQARLRLRDEEVRLRRAQACHQADIPRGHTVPGRQVEDLALGQ